jgi:hypothetical protein
MNWATIKAGSPPGSIHLGLNELGNTRLTCGNAAVPSEEVTQP